MTKVLIIEDNLDIRENTAEILELSGYSVICVENGEEGIGAATEHAPDVILCDIMMPKLNGYEVLEGLKKDAKTGRIPFIYVTASAEKKDILQAMEMGADGYICKPFEVNELIDEINRVLSEVGDRQRQ